MINDFAVPSLHPQMLTFNSDGTLAAATGCETVSTSWAIESDGNSIGFSGVPQSSTGCTSETELQDELLRRALIGARTWIANSTEAIELHGADVVQLRRAGT
jgi:hypothetical protein